MKISHNEVDDDLFVDVQEEVFLLLFSIYQKYLQFRKKRAQTLEISRGKDFEVCRGQLMIQLMNLREGNFEGC